MIRLIVILFSAASLFVVDPLAAASVTLHWTAPGDDGTTGTATQYDIRYSTTPLSDANWETATQVQNELLPSSPGSLETFQINGLKSGATYYFAIKTADEKPNWSVLSNVIEKETCGGKCISTVGNVNGSDDGRVDLMDLSLLQSYVLGLEPAIQVICLDAANCNLSADGVVDLSDLSIMIAYFYGNAQLAPCPTP